MDIQNEVNRRLDTGDCRKKLNQLLSALGAKNLKYNGKTGIDALVAKFFGENKVVERVGGGFSDYDSETGIINMNVDPSRGQNIVPLAQLLGTEFIHEALHGARGNGYFSHGDIYQAMAKLDGVDFKKFSKDRKEQLKKQNSKNTDKDSAMYRDAMNAWINKYCGG